MASAALGRPKELQSHGFRVVSYDVEWTAETHQEIVTAHLTKRTDGTSVNINIKASESDFNSYVFSLIP
jgi:hypothetical protein